MNTPTLTAEAERTDAIYQRACEVEHELRAEVKALKQSIESGQRVLREDAEQNAKRAERAEAELAAAKERLRSEAMDDYASIKDLQRELAAERARLDWLESDAGVDWQWSSAALTIRRAVIDAAMKEDAK